MLVPTRKTQEAIRITDDIRIVIVKTGANRVCIAIEAPEDMSIEREEIWVRRQQFVADRHPSAVDH